MNGIIKKVGILALGLLAICACENKTTKKNTTKSGETTKQSTKTTAKKTTKKGATSEKTSTTPSKPNYSINLGGLPTGLTITPKIGGKAIDTSKQYLKGTLIDFEIVNTLNKYLRVTINMSGKKYTAKWLDSCYDATDDDDIVYATIEDVELLGNLTINVSEVEDDVEPLSIVLDDSKDTETLKNTVYVYEPGTWEKAYENGDELYDGQTIAVVLNNYASDVTIKVRAGEKVLADEKYDQLTAGANGYTVVTYTLKDNCGVIYIETDTGSTSTALDARVANFMYNSTGISYKLYANDVEIQSGDEVTPGAEIKCTVTNNSPDEWDAILTSYYAGGDENDAIKVEVGTTQTLTRIATESVMFAIEDFSDYTVTHNSLPTGVSATIVSNKSTITSGTKVMRYSQVSVTIDNTTNTDYMLVLQMRDDYYGVEVLNTKIKVSKNTTYTTDKVIYIVGDLSISVIEDRQFTYTVNNPYSSNEDLEVYASINDGGSIDSGATISFGQEISFATGYPQNGSYNIKVTMAGTTIIDETVPSNGYNSTLYDVTGDVVVTITKK